jgi:hypothetical protein
VKGGGKGGGLAGGGKGGGGKGGVGVVPGPILPPPPPPMDDVARLKAEVRALQVENVALRKDVKELLVAHQDLSTSVMTIAKEIADDMGGEDRKAVVKELMKDIHTLLQKSSAMYM